jgi:O-methyltransferase
MKLLNFLRKIKNTLFPIPRPNYTYNQDGLATFHNCDFMKDEKFVGAYKAGKATNSWGGADVHWRVHVVLWAANQVKNLEGDFVECGVNKGGFSRAILEYLNFNALGKTFYLLDTFQGLDNDLLTEEEVNAGRVAHFEGVYEDCYAQVLNTFKGHNVKIIKGRVPETLSMVSSTKICYLSIDMNNVVPEIATINYFWDKLVTGAIVVLDDYAYMTCDLQYDAFNTFASQKGIKILSLPTGQGIIIK